jgi:lipopolysaccharide assembly outer membrane protein LptD (OstA)
LEVAYVVKKTIKDSMDFTIYARYLDGFSIGFEFRFGKKIKNNKFQQGILKGKNKKDITK